MVHRRIWVRLSHGSIVLLRVAFILFLLTFVVLFILVIPTRFIWLLLDISFFLFGYDALWIHRQIILIRLFVLFIPVLEGEEVLIADAAFKDVPNLPWRIVLELTGEIEAHLLGQLKAVLDQWWLCKFNSTLIWLFIYRWHLLLLIWIKLWIIFDFNLFLIQTKVLGLVVFYFVY